MPQIKVKIDPQGRVKFEGVGFTGQTCLAATKPLEDALGLVNVEHHMKEEAYVEETQQEQEYQ